MEQITRPWLPNHHMDATVALVPRVLTDLLAIVHVSRAPHPSGWTWWTQEATTVDQSPRKDRVVHSLKVGAGNPPETGTPLPVPMGPEALARLVVDWCQALDTDHWPPAPNIDGSVKPCAVHVTTSRPAWHNVVTFTPEWGVWGK